MIEVRRIPEDRWKDHRELRLEALRREPSAFASSVEEEEKFSEQEWRKRVRNALFALDDDMPVGMIVVLVSERPKTRHIAEIFSVFVRSDYRGRGIGTMLLECALSTVRTNAQVIKVKLAVNPEQQAAVRLYTKMGFLEVGRLRKEIKVGDRYFDMVAMERLL